MTTRTKLPYWPCPDWNTDRHGSISTEYVKDVDELIHQVWWLATVPHSQRADVWADGAERLAGLRQKLHWPDAVADLEDAVWIFATVPRHDTPERRARDEWELVLCRGTLIDDFNAFLDAQNTTPLSEVIRQRSRRSDPT